METRKILAILVLALGLLVWAGAVSEAGSPMGTAWTYQGRLIDANNAADGEYDFQFKLYDDANVVDGNQVGGDVNAPDVYVIDGYFTVELDFGSEVFDGNERWLQIGVRAGELEEPNEYTFLSPRQEVTPTAYSLQTRGLFVDDALNVGIGTASPATKLEVNVSSQWDGIRLASEGNSVGKIALDGDSGYFNLYSEGALKVSLNSETNSFINAGNVGIGTTSPSAKLDVNGTIVASSIYVPGPWDTWTAKESNRDWWSVAMSADGTIQTAVVAGGQIYVSTDSGNIWAAKESNRGWSSVAMSSDGTKQTAVVSYGQIYVSTDCGNTWAAKESNRDWSSVAMSADGTKQTAVVSIGRIYVSTDSGNTWTAKTWHHYWLSVAMSADGTIQTAVAFTEQIYVSTDSGNTWTAKESNRDWTSVAMSADGTIQTAVVQGGRIYVSTDSGNTWTAKESNRDWWSVAMSADGTIQTAGVWYGQIYVSTDSGNTWTAKESNISGNSVAMSADGTIQTAVVWGGQIYVSVAGRVGIGTTSPAEVLEVIGTVKANWYSGVPWRSPQWVITNAGTDTTGLFPPAGNFVFWRFPLPYSVRIEGFVINADEEANGDSFSFALHVDQDWASADRITGAEVLNDYDVRKTPFTAGPIDVTAGSWVTVKSASGNGVAELACWLYGRYNE